MRTGVIAALLMVSVPASADPTRLEASGFLGVDYFGDENGLGNSPADEQRPQTAPTFGGRITAIVAKIGGATHLDIGAEAEATFTPAWTGYGFEGPRPSYFAPVIGYHGGLLLRLGGHFFQPHVTAAGGGESVLSGSPYMAKETDPVFLWGVGGSFAVNARWLLRVDARQGLMEDRSGHVAPTYEAHMSVGARLGVQTRATPKPVIEVVEPKPPEPPRDFDGDGMLGDADACPAQAETVNGFEDQDGCPETDRDGDGLVDGVDKCPDRAEDLDKFEDEDGCADDDNDTDGVPDLRDTCPLEPEITNGVTDEDGCPDIVPPEMVAALTFASGVKFEPGRARLSRTSKAALDKALAVPLGNPKLKITLTVHPDTADAKATELANKRLAVVKFYLTEQGVAMNNLTATVGAPATDKKAPRVELTVTPPTTSPAAPPTTPPAAPPTTSPAAPPTTSPAAPPAKAPTTPPATPPAKPSP